MDEIHYSIILILTADTMYLINREKGITHCAVVVINGVVIMALYT
jgi:hypothetical protein